MHFLIWETLSFNLIYVAACYPVGTGMCYNMVSLLQHYNISDCRYIQGFRVSFVKIAHEMIITAILLPSGLCQLQSNVGARSSGPSSMPRKKCG